MPDGGTQRLEPYSDYRDSGVSWLGAIPAHWDVRRNGRLFAQRGETGFPELPIMEVSLNTGVRVRDMSDGARKQVMSDRAKYKRAVKGDIAYNMMRMWQGAVGVAPIDGLVSPAYVVARPFTETESRYFSYLFRTGAYMSEVDGYSRGIVKDRNRLYWQDFKRISSCVPPPDEQRQIANVLDAHARVVQQFIRNRRHLIEALNEQKQAIIDRLVARGIVPAVRLKPSGIDWIGDIPEHWQQKRLKFVVRNINEQTNSQLPDEVYVALEHVECWTGRLTLPDDGTTFESQVKRFRANDVLFGKLRPYLAKVARPQVPGVCVGEFLILRTNDAGILPEFLEQKLRSKTVIDLINSSTFGAKMPRADWTFIGNVVIAYPPSHDEQRAILKQVGEQTATLQAALNRTQREIELIREYRTRLITDVVTGQLDVRNLTLTHADVEAEPGAADVDAELNVDADEDELVAEATDSDE